MSTLKWFDDALCRQVDPDLFFPENDRHLHQVKSAKLICRNCPVQADCYTYAVENNLTGVWGGTTDRERQELRKAG